MTTIRRAPSDDGNRDTRRTAGRKEFEIKSSEKRKRTEEQNEIIMPPGITLGEREKEHLEYQKKLSRVERSDVSNARRSVLAGPHKTEAVLCKIRKTRDGKS